MHIVRRTLLAFTLTAAACGTSTSLDMANADLAVAGSPDLAKAAADLKATDGAVADMVKTGDLTIHSICGQPGDPGNNMGVGKFCTVNSDCTGTAKLCTYASAPQAGAYFCTMICTPGSTDCGDGSVCASQMGFTLCVPGACIPSQGDMATPNADLTMPANADLEMASPDMAMSIPDMAMSTDLAQVSTADLAQAASADLAQVSTADLAQVSTADLAQAASADLAQAASADLAAPLVSVTINDTLNWCDVLVSVNGTAMPPVFSSGSKTVMVAPGAVIDIEANPQAGFTFPLWYGGASGMMTMGSYTATGAASQTIGVCCPFQGGGGCPVP